MSENPDETVTPRKKARRASKKTSKKKGRGGPRPGSGRPSFRPTIEQRQTVEEMKFCGESDAMIARALGIDDATLRKHFADELADGHAQRRKEVISLLFREARDGNVSALRRLEEIGRCTLEGPGDPGQKPAEPKRGKKEQQQHSAQQVSGIFSPPAPPRLVVSNT